MFISKHIYFVILIINLYKCACEISDKRYCVDDACTVPISRGKTLLNYNSPEPKILSFLINEEVVIYSKEAGSVANLWGAEIKGKRGYIPKSFVREEKLLNKNIKLVEGEKSDKPQVPNSSKDDVKPDKPLETFEIIDGTKIYMNPPEQVNFQDNVSSSEDSTKTFKNAISSDESKTPNEDNTSNPSFVTGNESLSTSDFIPYSLKINQAELSDLIPQSVVHHNTEEQLSTDKKIATEEKDITNEIIITKDKHVIEKITNEEKAAENTSVEEKTEANPSENDKLDKKPVADEKIEAKLYYDNILKKSSIGDRIDENFSSEQKNEEKTDEKTEETLTENKSNEQELTTEESIDQKTNIVDSPEQLSEGTKLPESSIPLGSVPPTLENFVNTDNDSAKGSKQPQSSEEVNVPDQVSMDENTDPATDSMSQTQYNEQVVSLKNVEEIKDKIQEIHNNLQKNAKGSEILENSGLNAPPTTMLPIFPSMGGDILNSASPLLKSQEMEQKLPENSADQNDININVPFKDDFSVHQSVSGNGSEENKSAEELETSEENKKDEIIISQNESVDTDEFSSSSNEEFSFTNSYNENDVETSLEDEEKYLMQTSSESAPEILENNENGTPDQIEFADDTVTDNPVSTMNEETDENSNNEDDSGGMFSIFTSFFDWSGSQEENNNDNSAIDNINKNNLKCDASDFYSFSFNSNMMMHLGTTIVIFITFLLFYLSVNKYRLESPLVAKINQLEKDLLIAIKEKESLEVKGGSNTQVNSINSEKMYELNQNVQQISIEKEELEVELNKLRDELEKRDSQIENLEKELETSTEVGLELNRLISEMLDPSSNGSEKLKENVEQFQRQLHEQTDVIKNITARLNAKEVENVELLLELEETKKNMVHEQHRIQELVEKVTSIEREKEAQQNALQSEIRVYQANYNELSARSEILNNELQILKTKLINSEREIDLKIKECNTLKESFKDISSMKNDKKKLNSILDGISLKAEYEQMKADIEKYVRELQQNQSEKLIIENKYQSLVLEVNELQNKYNETDKEKTETELKLDVLNNYFKKREAELQEEVLKYKSIWDAKEGQATSTTERIKLLQEEIENYKTQNETLKQEILSQEIALKSQISTLEKKAHENWVNARQAERKLDDARQEAAQLRNKLTFRQRNINEEMVPNGLDQNDTTISSQPSMYSPASPPLFFDNGRDQVTKSPIPGLPPFLPPPPGAPFVPPPVPNLPGMHIPPPFMPLLPPGFPGDHRPPPLGRMSSPPIKPRFSPESAFSPYERGSPSPIYDSEYGGRPYRNYSPYNSDDDRRGYRSPSPISRTKPRASKNSLASQNINRSHESLEKTNSKKSNNMV